MNESEIYEALGVTQEQPPAGDNPASGQAEAGKAENEGAAQAQKEQKTPEAAGGKEGQAAEAPAEGEKGAQAQEQSKDERAQHAAQRRRQEQEAAVSAAVQEALQKERERASQEMAAFFRRAQLKNTITGKPITTMDEFNQWETAYNEAKLKRDLKAGRLTPEAVQQLIDQTPAMKQVRELVQKDQETRRNEQQAAAAARMEQDLQEIRKLDPSVNTLEDLMKAPNAKELYDAVKSGKTILEAYRLVNFGSIMEKAAQSAAKAGQQQALNSAESKNHLKATGGQRGTGATAVPSDVMEIFRELNPGASDAEIQAYYQKINQ